MITTMYAVFDSAVGAYLRPFFHHTDESAIRQFTHDCISNDGLLSSNPEDFSLVRLAYWDDVKGELEPLHKQVIITALEAVAASQGKNEKGPRLSELQAATPVELNFHDQRLAEGSEHGVIAEKMGEGNGTTDGPHLQSSSEGEHSEEQVRPEPSVSDDV
mgnify:CR=1 FL=1